MNPSDYKICVIGLGYVGLPLARLFSTKFETVGFDMNQARVDAAAVKREYGIDIVGELPAGKYDALILAVAHETFKTLDIKSLLTENGVVYDVKGVLDRTLVDGRL